MTPTELYDRLVADLQTVVEARVALHDMRVHVLALIEAIPDEVNSLAPDIRRRAFFDACEKTTTDPTHPAFSTLRQMMQEEVEFELFNQAKLN